MIEIQYNKVCLISLNKELAIREVALPILQSKEAALRAETQKIRRRIEELEVALKNMQDSIKYMETLWGEFPELVKIKKVHYSERKAASVTVTKVESIDFDIQPFNSFSNPPWFLKGIEIIKEVLKLTVELINEDRILDLVEHERRKTTQKVNLYEKVQIPFFEESMRKIKRYLEDEENLSKSSQKILKQRIAASG